MLCAVALLCVGLPGRSSGQDKLRLCEVEPYDLLTLQEGMVQLKLVPLDIKPRAPIRKGKPGDKLDVRLSEKPSQQYAVAWQEIAELKLFEELLLDEAAELVKGQRFDEAYDDYQLLEHKYGDFPGVADAVERCLFQEAGYWHKQGQTAQAAALLNELYQRNRGFPNLRGALTAVVGKQIDAELAAGRIAAARALLSGLAGKYADDATVLQRQRQFNDEADKALAAACEHRQGGRLREAFYEATGALAWSPESQAAGELLAELRRRYPVLTVAVAQLPAELPPRDADAWAARRAGRLVARLLAEPVASGETGGEYTSACGSWHAAEDGRRWTLTIDSSVRWADRPRPVTAYDVSRRLLARAARGDGAHHPGWADLLAAIETPDAEHLVVELTRPHLRPLALVQTPLWRWDAAAADSTFVGLGPYAIDARDEQEATYRLRADSTAAGPSFQEIVERRFDTVDEALAALRSGGVTVLDRIAPWDLARVRAAEDVVVESYAFPTVHFLLPNRSRPLPASLLFRRALDYGIHRERIVREQFSQAAASDAVRVLAGPFPAGFAADSTIAPAAYDPRLALALGSAALAEVAPPGATAAWVLAHPPTETARRACRAIQQQLAMNGQGWTVELEEVGRDGPPQKLSDYDLWYVEWPVFDPLADVRRLLGPDSISRLGGSAIESALHRLAEARDRNAVRQALHELHRLVHDDTGIIPLWQINEHFAYRRELQGVAARPATLYQNIEQWKIVGEAAP